MTHYNKKPSDPVRYRPEDPNCYTYVDGYGFAPPPPVITERRMLQFYSNGLGFAILLYFLMAASVPFGVLRLFSLIWPVIRVYGNQVVASSSIIQLVNIFLPPSVCWSRFCCLCCCAACRQGSPSQ